MAHIFSPHRRAAPYNPATLPSNVALSPGTRLGAYEILSLIGQGGMGEVYRARDSRLNRDVAIKVLPADVTADHDRLTRFEREAQVLASLNHTNIAQIHGIDDSSGTPALVMELVEGPTLADRIAQGPIPLDEAWAREGFRSRGLHQRRRDDVADAVDPRHSGGNHPRHSGVHVARAGTWQGCRQTC